MNSLSSAFASSVRPTDLVLYLRSRGWAQLEASSSSIALERVDERGKARELLVPLHPSWRDYALRVAELFNVLADVEQREPASIVRDLEHVTVDIVRFRASSGDPTADGTIALEDGNLLMQSTYRAFVASACAAVEPKRAYHTRKPRKALDYVADVRLAQSEVGSYVVRAFSRVGPSLEGPQVSMPYADETEPRGEVPFARTVTETLATALQSLQLAATDALLQQSYEAFELAISKGVSADLCEAIGALHHSRGIRELSVDVVWAPSRPGRRSLARRTSFPKEVLQLVLDAGHHLRSKAPIDAFELEGYVIDVTRPSAPMSGTATLYGDVNGKPRKVSFDVSDEAWQFAHTAMNDRHMVRCEGELRSEGRTFTLRNVRNLRLAVE